VLERSSNISEGIVGVKAIGRITHEDYEKVLEPLLGGARREAHPLRLLCEVGPEFEGFTSGAAWEDAKLGARSLRTLRACAVVTDKGGVRQATRIAGFLLPCAVKVFPTTDREKAVAWLGSVPHEVGLTHQLLSDVGVLLIEPKGPLHAQDFDALATTVDPWIESHGRLQGVVVHTATFPGWQNFGSLVRHVQFVRDHHRKVHRIALAVDGKLAKLAPRIGEHVAPGKVKAFRHEQVEAAILWASATNGT
jgi:hypothetical protein